MPREPTKPKSGSDVSRAPGTNGPLPETKPSASEDIAAFVAKARAMSPHAPGAK